MIQAWIYLTKAFNWLSTTFEEKLHWQRQSFHPKRFSAPWQISKWQNYNSKQYIFHGIDRLNSTPREWVTHKRVWSFANLSDDTQNRSRIIRAKSIYKRPKGCTKLRWKIDVHKDLKKHNDKNWETFILERKTKYNLELDAFSNKWVTTHYIMISCFFVPSRL